MRSFVYAERTRANRQNPQGDRHFYRTHFQYTAGVGSRDVQVGDKVILVSGVSMPLIICHGKSSIKVVGPSIVEGIMMGQAWNPRRQEEGLEEFLLI